MKKYNDSKIHVTEEIFNQYGQLSHAIANSWNELMDRMNEEDEKYIVEIEGEAKTYIEEACNYTGLEFQDIVYISVLSFCSGIRTLQKLKKLRNVGSTLTQNK